MTVCVEEGCDCPARARGLCQPHYDRRRRVGTLPPKRRVSYDQCIIDGCDRTDSHNKGMCNMHYQRERKARGYKPPPLPPCTVDGCATEQWAKGFCGTHYQWQRRAAVTDPCQVEGCDAVGVRGNMCQPHYYRQLRHGDPNAGAARRYRNRLCLVDECGRRHEGLGLCRIHYRRFMNTGSLERSVPHSAFKPGNPSWNKGTSPVHTCEGCGADFRRHGRRPYRFCSKRCQVEVMRGEKHPRWVDGSSSVRRYGPLARTWRRAVLERDDYTCQLCAAREVPLHADHIKAWSLHPELRFDLENGRALCVPCHMKTPTWGAGSWRSRQQASA